MKRTKIDLSEEKQIITHMITNQSFLRQMSGIAKSQYFKTSYARIISSWIWDYWDKTETAPGKDIQDLYVRNKSKIPDEDDLELVADFLKHLSDEYENQILNNVTYAVQNAVTYFKLRSLEFLKDKIENSILEKQPQFAEKAVAEYTRVEKPRGSGIDLFRDTADIIEAFDNEEEYLFSYPGEWGTGKSDWAFYAGGFPWDIRGHETWKIVLALVHCPASSLDGIQGHFFLHRNDEK